ncbi:zinc-finger-containing protein [Burkholderia gladioli]|uniref:zinc-finger-containing protein n=1 Tax=Burkholderia gladioli TaxID=28095 RepID=UPI00163EF43F|nr:zinc-finger-containing protein [Burkholderia gladioli]
MTQLAEAFDRATGEKTPWNPSRRAVRRVLNPLPAPTVCRFCGGSVHVVRNSEIYGREFGEWPWSYLCKKCRAYVGMRPFTGIPLGTLADGPTRAARKRAKAAFQPLWQTRVMTKSAAYSWLAGRLGIAVGECHVGWFDVAMCDRVVEIINEGRPQ